jgi:hypothetical protein
MRALTLPALLLTASLAAQTFTAADAVPPNGTFEFSRYVADASEWSGVDTVGTGLTWNMSGLTWEADEPFTLTVMPAADSEVAALAPDATTCLLESISGDIELHWFYRNASDMLEAIGIVGVIPGITAELESTCPRLLLNYPATLGSVINSGIIGCDFTVGAESVERKVLGTGTLVLPFGSIPNMALIRTSICAVDDLDPKGGGEIVCNHNYAWYAQGNLLRPALTMSILNEEWSTAFLEVPTSSTSVNELHTNNSQLSLSPNPASDQLMLMNTDGHPLGELSILSNDGRTVYTAFANTDRMQLDVQGLVPGLYSVLRVADGRRAVLRFVKE